jgi:hypothetical protein
VQKLPDAEYPEPTMTWDLDKAIATPLTQAQVLNLTLTEGYEPGSLTLYDHFRESANSTEFEGGEEDNALFREWIEVLGLKDEEDVVVLNWINGVRNEGGMMTTSSLSGTHGANTSVPEQRNGAVGV